MILLPGIGGSPKLESLIVDLHRIVIEVASELEPLFNRCASEARFGASVIESDLRYLSPGGKILEIGAGLLLLSSHLQREGYAVTAVEPVGNGFSHFDRLRKIVKDYASDGGFAPTLFAIPAEDLDFESQFDFAFSINVMEHVRDVAVVLRRVISAMRPGACYRFICANYLFPYEPHFNMPTLFTKALTERIFSKWIRSSRRVVDSKGIWMSLNWISVSQVRRICRKELGVEPMFDRAVMHRFIQRALHDDEFRCRRGSLIPIILQLLDWLGATRLLMLMPAVCQPAMNCVIVRA